MHLYEDNLSHGKSRLRTPSVENFKEDMELMEKGVLDYHSFISAYQYHNHPVELIHTDKDGNLKSIRRTHNLRTNTGGTDQGLNMSGSGTSRATYIALATLSYTPNDQDTYLGGGYTLPSGPAYGSQAEETNASLSRQVASYQLTSPPAGSTGSTAQATYKLSATWSGITVARTISGCGVFNGSTVGTPGAGSDLWFVAALGSPVSVGSTDNLTLSYTINF